MPVAETISGAGGIRVPVAEGRAPSGLPDLVTSDAELELAGAVRDPDGTIL